MKGPSPLISINERERCEGCFNIFKHVEKSNYTQNLILNRNDMLFFLKHLNAK